MVQLATPKVTERKGRSPSAQICSNLRTQITKGLYAPGAALPSSRALAAELGVSRTTVTAAYDQLIAEGYLESRQGSKTRVAAAFRPPAPVRIKPTVSRTAARDLSEFGRRVLTFPPADLSGDRPAIDFRYGDLSPDDFPTLPWKRAITRVLLQKQQRLSYGDPSGLPELRKALQSYLSRVRGIRCEADQIIVVSGSQQALDLCARVFINPRDDVVIENPGYPAARQVFEAVGATLHPVPVDHEGMRTDLLENVRKGRLAYVTPSHQYPLGSVMSVSRRQALLTWATQVGAHIIEDDYDSEFRYDARPVEALQSLDREDVVIYVGTLSKTLSPQFRLGYLVVPSHLATVFSTAKRLTDRHTSTLAQSALADMLESGAYERHVRRVRRSNGERRSALLAAVKDNFGDDVAISGADAGLSVVLWLHKVPRSKESELIDAARANGIGVYPISPLFVGTKDRAKKAGVVLGYAGVSLADIRRGIRSLARVVETL
ncbi:PLP-dependent aminotransferase family protein [Bradyrhizobium sp. SYSU BS000235]|uniref:MocR-like pyridoxine biosynthesis transcription factor PdxR n=1 Tax=Bradyrhizobium sp. SYSU BS000235 TaxID=3411332 RepID=UPI003C70F318